MSLISKDEYTETDRDFQRHKSTTKKVTKWTLHENWLAVGTFGKILNGKDYQH